MSLSCGRTSRRGSRRPFGIALEKQPELRFPSMDAFATELRRCLEGLGDFDADRTIVRGTPAVQRGAARRGRGAAGAAAACRCSSLSRALVVLAAVIAALLLRRLRERAPSPRRRRRGSVGAASRSRRLRPRRRARRAWRHARRRATDGNPHGLVHADVLLPAQFGGLKSGLGLVLDAGKTVKLDAASPCRRRRRASQRSCAPGRRASGPFADDSSAQPVGSTTTFTLAGRSARYYVVWITRLPPGGKAAISEVTAR